MFVTWILFVVFLPLISSYPCPSECLCQPMEMFDVDFTRMSFQIDCRNIPLKDERLVYRAEPWTIADDQIVDDDDDDQRSNDYLISIDLSQSPTITSFHSETIQLTNFPFLLRSLSLTKQSDRFTLQSNAFNSSIYENLKTLNLSSCCREVPNQCPQLFVPLKKLEILDLSESNLYKTCLNQRETISTSLRDLILRNNEFDSTTFSHSSELFLGVRHIAGRLDLRHSRFELGSQLDGNCLFDQFEQITGLDLSFVEFRSTSNETEIHLKHFLQCQSEHGEELLYLFLRGLNLQRLPTWLNNERFPNLRQLDLSVNFLRELDINRWVVLKHLSLESNPIELSQIQWRAEGFYDSINLRSTVQNRTFNLTRRLTNLFRISKNLDYSDNFADRTFDLKLFPRQVDFVSSNGFALNLSRTKLSSIDLKNFEDLFRLDVSENQLTELNLQQQRNLAFLQCSNQNLTKLILSPENSNLIELNCSKNFLKTVEFFSSTAKTNLKIIDLSFNSIENLDDFFANFSSRFLRTVNFRSNRIVRIASKTFHRKLISLFSIDLSNNQIDSIETNAFETENLQILDLTGNPLKKVQANFLFTSSLRLFYLINHPEEFVDRCAQSTSDDLLLFTYVRWFDQNGTFMRTTQIERSEQIQLDKCLRRYTSRSKVKWVKVNEKHRIQHLSLYITMAVISVAILLGGIFFYRKNRSNLSTAFSRYRPLDRNGLVENMDDPTAEHPREDDEIVMNLSEPPFTNQRS